ncbi:hypothetical protein [Salinilacihabitans rarus]|uniref:hypothetical protein n=1 Tax=Salinilacihabitans rarus TaxID=2961596 RepID=UPI0020C8563D|nr:hypothetical protein [Salinilacihabitans rarus]
MEDTSDASGRRRFLSLAAGVGTAALAGCTTPLSSWTVHAADESTTVGPSTTGLTDDERDRYVDRVAERYGPWAADEIVPDAALGRRLQPGIALGNLVWDGEQSLSVTDSSGATLAESDNYVAIYENEQSSASEDERYVYWLWSCARPREAGELRKLWSHVDVTGGRIEVYDPGGDRSDNGTVSPHPEKTGLDTDEFAVRWRGEHDGVQVVTGSLSVSRDDGDERDFEWTAHLGAGTR